jgi:poly(beta-D-mannuronate) lyase
MRRILISFLASLFLGSAAAAASLVSPWDVRVQIRGDQAAACPVLPRLSADLSAQKYYAADGASIDKNKKHAYLVQTDSVRDAARDVTRQADAFRESGNPEHAHCAARLLLDMARLDVLGGTVNGNQANVFRAWMLNAFATSWLKIRQSSGLDSASSMQIEKWLGHLAEATVAFHDRYKPKMKAQNLRYWGGLAVMNAGIALDRRDLFDWGLQWGRNGANAVQPDGTLPQELRRKDRARKYHLFALEPLVAMAEIALANNVDLYALNNRGIQRLAHTTLASLKDPSLIARLAKTKQAPQSVKGTNLAWLAVLAKRYPDPYYDSFLKKYPVRPDDYLGGDMAPEN